MINNEHNCNEHGCDCHDHEFKKIKIVTEDNKELECSVLDIFEVEKDKFYIALLPIGEEDVFIYRYIEKTNNEFELKNIETDEEFEKVKNVFFDIIEKDNFDCNE